VPTSPTPAPLPAQSELDDNEQEEKKQKSELAVASRLIQHIDWKGRVLTGDALYCQRSLCTVLRQAGGDYLFLLKGNQPQLLEDVRLLFAPPAPPNEPISLIYTNGPFGAVQQDQS
jgi:hypothetical protein